MYTGPPGMQSGQQGFNNYTDSAAGLAAQLQQHLTFNQAAPGQGETCPSPA